MPNQKLREILEQLHLELLQSSPATKELEEKRATLINHIREALEKEDLSDHYHSLSDALNDTLTAFEEAHPKVTQLISVCTNILNAIGV